MARIFPGHGIYVQYNTLQPCKHAKDAKDDGREMLCRMPAVDLPDDLNEQLNHSESGTINNTRGSGVAVYESADGHARADIYVGLKLDGFKRYENISAVNATIKLQFALKPIVLCKHDDVDFDPNTDSVIAVKVSRIYFAVKCVKWIRSALVSTALQFTFLFVYMYLSACSVPNMSLSSGNVISFRCLRN